VALRRTHLLLVPSDARKPSVDGDGDTVIMNITIGRDALTRAPFQIDPTRHVNIIGATGMGKSALLENLFTEFVKQGHGGLFMDVHGDVYDRLSLILPSSRKRDFIFFDPDLDSVPTFNPLFFTDPAALEQAKETCVSLLKAMAGSDSAWGNETPHNIRADIDAVCENVPHPTLIHVYRFLIDDEYRDRLLGASSNPFLALFKRAFDKLRHTDQTAKLAPGINKLSKLMRPNILPIIGHYDSIDPLQIMNERKILICRISKGRLGEETARVLYSLIISMFAIAALKREKQTERPDFIIVADEAQNGTDGGKFGTLLAEARKYGISLVTAFQGSYQMPIMRDILTNAATQISFNVSGDDAQMLADNWRVPEVLPSHITDLSRYEFYARTFENNQPIVRKVLAPTPLKPKREDATRIIKQSLMRWATPKDQTMTEINRFLSSSA
jgi:hypothetical protein